MSEVNRCGNSKISKFEDFNRFIMNKKIVLLCFIATLSSALSQDILIMNCEFSEYWEYQCLLEDKTVLDPTQDIMIFGQHLENRTDDDVRLVRITNSNTPFIIPQIFTTFRNVIDLYIDNSNLQSIRIPDTVQLHEINIYGNNISRLESGSFDGQTHLWYLNLRDNGIREIDEDAFVGLGSLETLDLIGNHIENLTPQTLHPLTNLTLLDLQRNNLTRIDDELFAQTPSIRYLYLEHNQIEEISPRLISRLDHIGYINLLGNSCVDRSFPLNTNDDFTFIVFHNSLQSCYNNFIGSTSETKRVVLEFLGPMKLYDEFGNLVASL